MKIRRLALVLVLVLALGAALAVVPFPAGEVVTVADRFAPVGAASTIRTVEPRRLLCLGANPCPSVHQTWTFTAPVPTSDLRGWLDDAGYLGEIEGDCSATRTSGIAACSVRGTADGRRFSLFVRAQNTTTTLTLTLR